MQTGYDYTDMNNVVEAIENDQQFTADVISIAVSLRAGQMEFRVSPVSNGFLVAAGTNVFIAKTAADVGLLTKTLYSSDLTNEKILKRLRRMTGKM
jgi:hypothetical protein